MTFGEYIRSAREEKGISQKSLAKLLCISPAYMNDIEQSRRYPSSESILTALSDALDIDIDYIYYLSGKFPPKDMLGLDYFRFKRAMHAFRWQVAVS